MAFYKLGTREGGVNPTGNAVEANVLKNKTFSNASGINKIGTMPDNSTTTSNGTVPGINSSYPNVPIRPGSNVQMGVNTDGVKQLAIEPPQGYYPGGGSSYIGVDADDLGDAVASDVVSGKTFTSESGIEVIGTRENSGTYTASSRNAALDMGNPNTYRYVNTTGVPNSNTETYTASSRGASLDMGATNNYRYVNTNGVPNSNSGTYTFPANDTGGTKDLGVTNTYRYVNATNVYNKGKADGQASVNFSAVYNTTQPEINNNTLINISAQKGNKVIAFYNHNLFSPTMSCVLSNMTLLNSYSSGPAKSCIQTYKVTGNNPTLKIVLNSTSVFFQYLVVS